MPNFNLTVKILLIILFLSITMTACQQHPAHQNETTDAFKMPINCSIAIERSTIYLGYSNIITALAENCSCDSLSLTTDNGSINKINSCKYEIKPVKLSRATITMSMKVKGRNVMISQYYVDVEEIQPVCEIYRLRSSDGKILKDSLLNANSIIVYYKGFDFSGVRPRVLKYRIIVMRDDKTINIENFDNPIFGEEVKKVLNSVQKGDMIIFEKIICVLPSGETKLLHPIEYEIK